MTVILLYNSHFFTCELIFEKTQLFYAWIVYIIKNYSYICIDNKKDY
jgi:hypothetical protein